MIVLTEDLRVRVWSPGAEDLWGLRPEEATSKDVLSLDIGLPTAEIAPWLRGILVGTGDGVTSTIELSALNRRGKTVELRVAGSPMRSEEGAISGLILVIDQTAAE